MKILATINYTNKFSISDTSNYALKLAGASRCETAEQDPSKVVTFSDWFTVRVRAQPAGGGGGLVASIFLLNNRLHEANSLLLLFVYSLYSDAINSSDYTEYNRRNGPDSGGCSLGQTIPI